MVQNYLELSPNGLVCEFIPSLMREGSTFLVITGVQFFRTELIPVRKAVAEDFLLENVPSIGKAKNLNNNIKGNRTIADLRYG